MGKPTGFLEKTRQLPENKPPQERIRDYHEFEIAWGEDNTQDQASRCMDCGVPGCHDGCPLGNLIPDWNDLVYKGHWREALAELHRTNNFPEITGRVCPAPCETSCILGINEPPVAIKHTERAIIEKGFKEGWVAPVYAKRQTWKRVAVVGSGPAGLAAAQQLSRLGHLVTVFEKNERPGGLLTLGIPDFKLEKTIVDRRIQQMIAEGVTFRNGCEVGKDMPVEELLWSFNAVVLAGGSQIPRGLDETVAGRDLKGIHTAMDFLSQQNRRVAGLTIEPDSEIKATHKRVVVLGGGDTGSDCVGTSIRQGAASVHQFEIMPKPPKVKNSTSHEEGGERRWSVLTKGFTGDAQGRVTELHGVEVEWLPPPTKGERPQMREVPGTAFTQPVDLVLMAMGFIGPVRHGLLDHLGVDMTERGTVSRDEKYQSSVAGVFVAGDMGRGQSLVVWAIWEGRQCARQVHEYLMANR